MNTYLHILFFLSVTLPTVQYCMEPMPKQYKNSNWRQDLRDIRNNPIWPKEEREKVEDNILEYAVDRYEKKGGIKLAEDQREKVKATFLKRVEQEAKKNEKK